MFTKKTIGLISLGGFGVFALGSLAVLSLWNPSNSQTPASAGQLSANQTPESTNTPAPKPLSSPSPSLEEKENGAALESGIVSFPDLPNPSAPPPSPNPGRINHTATIGSPKEESEESLSQEKAIQIVQQWLETKRKILAPPYDLAPLEGITTGEVYLDMNASVQERRITNNPWKQKPESIGETVGFTTSTQTAWLRIGITSDRPQIFQYRIEKDTDKTWKIAEIREVK